MPTTFKQNGKKSTSKAPSKSPATKTVSKQVSQSESPPTSVTSTASGLDSDAESKFEIELCWCIQQLELSILSGKLSEKKLKDSTKSLKTLKNNTTSLIHKRQLMRSTFGDYRAKMAQDEKKYGKSVFTAKFSPVNLKDNKSVFIKKAQNNLIATELSAEKSTADNGKHHTGDSSDEMKSALITPNVNSESFKFNFDKLETEK